MNNLPCSVCGEAGHHPMRCPELCAPLKPGFSGANGGGGHGGDEEDEKARQQPKPISNKEPGICQWPPVKLI
jgi:hypothetical protein